jgi:ABC-type branched-subunit amino acid transport system substrate-binding protein
MAHAAGALQAPRSGSLRPGSPGGGVDLWVRDSKSEAGAAAGAAEALAGDGVIALIGPMDGASAAAAADRAAGAPLLTLDPRPEPRPGGLVFHLMHSAEARAAALARAAHRRGIRKVAVLAPASGYGRAVGDAFRAEWKRLGGTLVASVDYQAAATTFGEPIGKLGSGWQALFVPDQAARLALIAPALATAGLAAQPADAPAPRQGRAFVLLSTAEGIDERFPRGAGRYTVGALLAPGFYPDRFDDRLADFIDRYELGFGRLPTAWDAYAADGITAITRALAAGARSRADLAAALAGGEPPGLTGRLEFTPAGLRRDDGVLYTVELRSDSAEPVVRALRE